MTRPSEFPPPFSVSEAIAPPTDPEDERIEVGVAIVGAGRVGTAIAVLLRRAGHRIGAVAGREATAGRAATYLPGVAVLPAEDAAAAGELVLVGVPDDEILRRKVKEPRPACLLTKTCEQRSG